MSENYLLSIFIFNATASYTWWTYSFFPVCHYCYFFLCVPFSCYSAYIACNARSELWKAKWWGSVWEIIWGTKRLEEEPE